MFSFQDPNLKINVDVWTELQQRSSSLKGTSLVVQAWSPWEEARCSSAQAAEGIDGRSFSQGIILVGKEAGVFSGALLYLALSSVRSLA